MEEQDVFDLVYSLMKEFPCLTPGCKLNLVESLRSNISVLLRTVDSLWRVSLKKDGNVDEERNDSEEDECSLADRVASSQNAFQIYTFFLIHIVLIDKSKSSSNNITKVYVLRSKARTLTGKKEQNKLKK
uniref:Condensin complex subunit 1 n=1 Tax=Solanum tuberosum TaxID=4113 RepID=M1BVF5_SOLTU